MRVLEANYHTQRNNRILPYSTCGTTCLAEYLSWLNKWKNETFTTDDDAVFRALNSQKILDRASALIGQGETYIKDYLKKRADDPKTEIDESQFNYTNQLMIMLCETGKMLTEYEYDFSIAYRDDGKIEDSINEGFPVIIAGKFTASGHYVMIVGYDETNWIIDDPYGNWKTKYSDLNGAKVKYPRAEVLKIAHQSNGKYLTMRSYKK